MDKDIEAIVSATGETEGRPYGFTYSDLMQRLLPSIVLDAYPDRNVTGESALVVTKMIIPTSPFQEN